MSMQQIIHDKLNGAFRPDFLRVENESRNHNVPVGSESHFKITLVTDQFMDLTLINRHRQVHEVLDHELKQIHALALHTMTNDEWADKNMLVNDSPLCQGGG